MPGSLNDIYNLLYDHFGMPHTWWPIFGDDAPFEMLLGAILVQQTRWETVEQAILAVQAADLLSPEALRTADSETLAQLLRPTAFYRQKAPGIIAIGNYLCTHYQGSTAALLAQPTEPLRRELLALPRIGPETADVILLYAGRHPVFVVDDYTRRLLGRIDPRQHAATDSADTLDWSRARYDRVQAHIVQELGSTAQDDQHQYYSDYHALINEQCVRYCLARRPRCNGPPARRVYSIQQGRESYLDREDGCPLRHICAFYQASQQVAGEVDKQDE
jgi:endonuclease-3 related protein